MADRAKAPGRGQYLTAPKRAPSHSALRVSTVLSGRATPVFWKVSKPASRSTKENLRFKDEGRASRMRRPAGMTSRPMPSPGIRPGQCLAMRYPVYWSTRQTNSKSSGSHGCRVVYKLNPDVLVSCLRGEALGENRPISGCMSSRILGKLHNANANAKACLN